MHLIDIHCHLDEHFYKDDIDKVILRAKKNNVKIMPAGVNPDTNRFVLKLKEKYPDVIYPCIGIYPPDALKTETKGTMLTNYNIDEEIKFIEDNDEKTVAIAEVGMDAKTGTDLKSQEDIFRKMIKLAIKLDKALIIHSRKAEQRVIEILEQFNYNKFVMHCFGGNHRLVQRIRQNKWYFSIPTSIVRDQHFQKIVKETPMYLLLTETDAPYLSPFRDKKNEPSFVIETIKKISKLKNTPLEDVSNLIYRNAERLFRI